MRVEEICNYALLHFLYWKYTGDDGPMLRHFRFLAEQVLNLLRADTDGNGYPDLGVANTLDDAPAAVHSAANGTYLGLKTYAAARAVEAMAIRANRLPVAKKCQRLQERIERTLRSSWLDGRYPVHLPGSSPAAGAVMHAGVIGDERAGDAVSYDGGAIYGPLGLLPLLLTGIDLPDEPDRLLADLRAQRQLTLTKYGSAHSTGMTNVWVSQNLVRDTIGMYLSGADEWFQDAPRYWQLQLDLAQRAQGEPELAGYTDSPVNPVLTSYSRGGAVFGYWLAAAGLTCDAQAGVVGYSTPDTAAPWPLWFLRKQGAALPLLVTGADGARKLTGELKFPARAEPAPAPRAAASAGEREAPVSGGSDGGER